MEDITGSGSGTTSHTVTELTNGTEYVFQIRAVNAGGTGEASDEKTATPSSEITTPTSADFELEVFKPHKKLVASRISDDSDFPYTAPTAETRSAAEFYAVKVVTLPGVGKLKTVPYNSKSTAPERDVSAGQTVPVVDIQSSRSTKVLAYFPREGDTSFNTSFTFKVIDVIGTSTDRKESAATYTATLRFEGKVVNSKPVFSTFDPADQEFTVGEVVDSRFAWSNSGDGKLKYTLTPELPAGLTYDGDGPDDSGVDPGEANAPSFEGTPVRVTAAKEYTLTVSDTDNVTGPSDEDTVRFNIEVVASEEELSAPENLSAERGANMGEVDLSWDAIATASNWQVRYKQVGGDYNDWADISGSDARTTSHTVTGLAGGVSYTFAVRAVNGGGAGPYSEASVTLAGLVVSPTSLRVTEGGSTRSLWRWLPSRAAR